MARITAAVANGGTLVTPHVIQHESLPAPTKIDAPDDVWKTVQLGMRDTVTYGSGRALSSLPMPNAGKTGTAQWKEDVPNHAWYIGFAPFDHPQIVVTVLLEEGGEGSSFAVPVAGDILRAWNAEQGAGAGASSTPAR
jgi:cell division protein FtsI/penicillin-binding protein 2